MQKKRKLLNHTSLILTILILMIISLFYYFPPDFVLSLRTLSLRKYQNIEMCNEFKKQFELDLKNNEVKFFLFGLPDERNEKIYLQLKSKYNIEMFLMGCVVIGKYNCYSQMVNEYLISQFGDSSLQNHIGYIPERE